METPQDGGSEPQTTVNPTQQAKLTADDGDSEDFFGQSVSLSSDGTTAVIGAPDNQDPNGPDAGSAYIFETVDGVWTQQAKLTADDGDSWDYFGYSVALSGDGTVAIIGSTEDEDPNGTDAGSAYVFERTDSAWTQQAKLTADDGDSVDFFGFSVALSSDGTTAAIGAYQDEHPSGTDAGSAYVFERTDGAWTQQAKLTGDTVDSRDFFGYSVALSSDGTTAVVGATGDENPNGPNAGSAYVFENVDGGWTQQATLAADDGDSRDYFGHSVTLSSDGTTSIVCAPNDEDPNGTDAGSAYVFERSDGTWTQQAKLAADDGDSTHYFGDAGTLSADGSVAIIGSTGNDDPNGTEAGSAYVFGTVDGGWTQQAKLVADDGDSEDFFGHSVALSSVGTTGIVCAPDDEDPNGPKAGSAYVFDM